MSAQWINPSQEDIDALLEAKQKGTLCPFIGSGFSKHFGYPTWAELLQRIADDPRVAYELPACASTQNPLEVAEALRHVYAQKNYETVETAIENCLKEPELGAVHRDIKAKTLHERAEPSDVHREIRRRFAKLLLDKVSPDASQPKAEQIALLKQLPQLGAERIFTTNYDSVIKKEIYAGQELKVVRNPRKYREVACTQKPVLLKLHGDKKALDRVVATHSDYMRFVRDDRFWSSLLLTTFFEYTVVFLGYGFRDINIHHIHASFLDEYGLAERHKVNSYMVLTTHDKPDGLREQFLRGNSIIPMRWNGELGEFIEAFAEDRL